MKKIEFAKKNTHGKILDVTNGDFLSYYSANLLLNAGAIEVWSYDISENEFNICKRFFNENNERVLAAFITKMYDDDMNIIAERLSKYEGLFEKYGSKDTISFF